ncbi:Vesicle-associated membrane protein [Porphyridium purpureum]|uniref:Vesicle-associated membrane protein n=1 Tax=Porphyridium purpureum TaxID=35688 RepID=A0A5J4YUM8_PORPP|nr:Vesicle-associated membrane protein [Porphyridium purpureum]|eukprot:POR3444..scf227_4
MAEPNVRFLAVARLQDRVPLLWYCSASDPELHEGKFRKLLASGRVAEHARLTVTDRDVGTIHFECDPVCVYMTMCDPSYPQRTAFQLLTEFRDEFSAEFGPAVRGARDGEMNKSGKRMVKAFMETYDQARNVDQLEGVKYQVDEVKGVMENNIQQALNNQENLDTLVDKTDVMRNEASNFQRSSQAAKNKFWWQNTTFMVLIVIAAIVLVLVIVVLDSSSLPVQRLSSSFRNPRANRINARTATADQEPACAETCVVESVSCSASSCLQVPST